MADTSPVITLSPRDYDAILFDLDGVLTKTARVHAAAWKRLFDQFLDQQSVETGESFVPFDINDDYRRHVDGKPRQDGVVAFLQSRKIDLPLGAPDDASNVGTVHGLGNLKDQYFLEELDQKGVERYEASIELLHTLRAEDVKTGVVSSSNNCAAVLAAAEIADLFDVRVDGLDIDRLALNGKPAPDGFFEAARRLRLGPPRVVVVEDAIAGVQAGRAGGFGLVIGVDRGGQPLALRRAGADVVVADLAEIRVAIETPSTWSLVFDDFDPGREGIREALCTLGNGYFGTRGAAPGSVADGIHYPGTYLAGGYNRLQTEIAGRVVENKDLVNLPNWLALGVRLADADWFDERHVTLLEYRQELDLRRGMLLRTLRFDDGGRRSTLRERRLVSMHDMHLAALEVSLTPENWSGRVTIRTAIDGRIVNSGARLYRKFNNTHLVPVTSEAATDNTLCLAVRTSQSNVHVAQAARTAVILEGQRVEIQRRSLEEPGYVAQVLTADVAQGQTLSVEKVVSLYTSRDHAISEPAREARTAVARAGLFADLMAAHRRLDEARAAARRAGCQGAMFPWQSGSNGEEVTQVQNLNARSGRWMPDNSHLQRHIGSAIAYNVWQYFQVTQDLEFLEFYGAELILEIARFWSSVAQFNEARGRYEIHGVMGPDEYHDGYPDVSRPGLANNAYTNVMAVWVLWRALDALKLLSAIRRAELTASLGLTSGEIARWDTISRRMFVPLQADGVISQFEGYEALREFDWDAYRTRYGSIQRLDLILEAENDTPNRYKLSKQADVLMLFYLFSAEELRALFGRLGYQLEPAEIPRNVDYYDGRTSHGSTLCRVVHSWVLARSNRRRSMSYFAEALQSDVTDIQQGTTREGVHLGAMAGTVDLVQRVSTGIEVTGDVLRLNPRLPQGMDRLDMRIRYRGHSLDVRLTRESLIVRGRDRGPAPIRLGFKNEVYEFSGGRRAFTLE